MRDIREVLAEKEQELQEVTQQLDALRLVARLLADEPAEASKGVATMSGNSRIAPATPKVKVFP